MTIQQVLLGGGYAPMTVTLLPTTATGTAPLVPGIATSNPVTVNVQGGTGNYSYAWTRVSGDTATTTYITGGNIVTFQREIPSSGGTFLSTWRCTVNDGVESVISGNVAVSLTGGGIGPIDP